MELRAKDELTLDIIESGCVTWEDLVRSVRNFKYGRGENRGDFDSVWYRREGTCSTKHGFLFRIAERNELNNVQLMVGIYLMTEQNTPKVAEVLKEFGLHGIPEAHCYLKVGTEYLDATSNSSTYEALADDVAVEKSVVPEFLIAEKIDFHKEYLTDWLNTQELPFTLNELWNIREKCIAALSRG